MTERVWGLSYSRGGLGGGGLVDGERDTAFHINDLSESFPLSKGRPSAVLLAGSVQRLRSGFGLAPFTVGGQSFPQ